LISVDLLLQVDRAIEPTYFSRGNKIQVIRDTWAKGHEGVFFLVAGPWEAIEKEFEEYGDLLWLNEPEDYERILYKTASFFSVVHQVSKRMNLNVKHALKTDDDSYVALPQLKAHISELEKGKGSAVDYWGQCSVIGAPPIRDPKKKWVLSKENYPQDRFPPFCQGAGYILSRELVDCVASGNVQQVRTIRFEDGTYCLLL